MLEENGRLLKVTREALGLSLDAVEEATKVREYYLQLLENGDLSGMPGRIYAIGFAETYAKFLGIDPAGLLEDIKAFYAKNSADVGFEAYVSGKKVVQAVAEGGSPNAAWHEVKDKAESRLADQNAKAESANQLRASAYANVAMGRPIRSRSRRFGKRFLWVLLGSVVITLLLALYLLQDNPELPGFLQGSEQLPVAESEVQANAAPVTIIVTAQAEEIWVGATVDGTKHSQVTLAPGLSQAFTAQNHLYLRFNKATHTTVEYNGQTLEDFSAGSDIWNFNFYTDSYDGYADQPVGSDN